MESITGRMLSSSSNPARNRRVHEPRADGLRVEQRVAWQRAAVSDDAVGMHGAEHRQSVLGLVVLDGVAAHHERARLGHLVGPAAQHLAHHVGAEAAGEREDVECGQRLCAHGEHVGQCVRRGDGAELVGIVHHRREEVERQHGSRLVVQPVNGGVVGRVEAQQQVGVGRRRDVLQYFFEVARTPLRRSTALLGEVGEAYALGLAHGRSFPRSTGFHGPLARSFPRSASKYSSRRASGASRCRLCQRGIRCDNGSSVASLGKGVTS